MPCPHCTPSMKSHQWALLSGALGDYLLSSTVSGVWQGQSEALRGVMRICGLMRVRVVDKFQQSIKQSTVVEVLTMCEARLPLYTCRYVRHSMLHFYELGGWADDVGPAGPLQK